MYLQLIPFIQLMVMIRDNICELSTDEVIKKIEINLNAIKNCRYSDNDEKSKIIYCLCSAIDQSILHNTIYCPHLSFNLFTSSNFDDNESGINIINIINVLKNNPNKYHDLRVIIRLLIHSGFIIEHEEDSLEKTICTNINNYSKNSTRQHKKLHKAQISKISYHCSHIGLIIIIILYQNLSYSLDKIVGLA